MAHLLRVAAATLRKITTLEPDKRLVGIADAIAEIAAQTEAVAADAPRSVDEDEQTARRDH